MDWYTSAVRRSDEITRETSVEDCDEDHHVDHLLQREKSRRNSRWNFLGTSR